MESTVDSLVDMGEEIEERVTRLSNIIVKGHLKVLWNSGNAGDEDLGKILRIIHSVSPELDKIVDLKINTRRLGRRISENVNNLPRLIKYCLQISTIEICSSRNSSKQRN